MSVPVLDPLTKTTDDPTPLKRWLQMMPTLNKHAPLSNFPYIVIIMFTNCNNYF